MKKRHLTIVLTLLVLLVAFGGHSSLKAAPAQQGTNLLINASFEQPFVNGAADGWTTWHQETEKTDDECLSGYHFRPKWNMETVGANVNNGIASQYVGNNWDTWAGGVYQTVDVTPGTTYRFSFFAKGRATSEPAPNPSDFGVDMNVRAAVDPNGSGQWYDSDVVWGPSSSPHDNWQQFSVEATATGDKMTVFTSANLGVPGVNQCRQYLDTWYDNAELMAIAEAAPPTAPPPPPATAAPANTPAPQPTATAEAAPTAEPPPMEETEEDAQAPVEPSSTGGTICVNAFHDVNANGLLDPNEEFMADVTFTVANQTAIIGTVISDGTENHRCFVNLEPGPYQVAQQVPADLLMTSEANVALEVGADQTAIVAFGSRVRGAPITEAPPVGGESGSGETQPVDPTKPTSGGMICVNAFHDENANAVVDPNEGYMAGVTMTVSGPNGVVGQVQSTGSETPLCFDNLDPDTYEVTQQVSEVLEMTTADRAMVAVAEGQALQLEFGSRLKTGEEAPSGTGEDGTDAQNEGDGGGPNLLTIGGLAAIILGVILLGALIFFLLRR